MSEMDRVWSRIKKTASAHAARGRLLSNNQARAEVLTICCDEKAECPSDDGLEYLASELLRMTLERFAAAPRAFSRH